MNFRCRVHGYPVPQGRPKAFIPKGWTRPTVYDPATSRDWKRTVNSQVLDAKPGPPMKGALTVRLVFVLLRPPSVSEKKRPFPTVKPDAENLSKAVLDAIKGVVYLDDAQIVDLRVRKEYGEQPGVEIDVEELPGGQADGSSPRKQHEHAGQGALGL